MPFAPAGGHLLFISSAGRRLGPREWLDAVAAERGRYGWSNDGQWFQPGRAFVETFLSRWAELVSRPRKSASEHLRIQPTTTFSRLPPVRRADLEGQRRVELTRSLGPRSPGDLRGSACRSNCLTASLPHCLTASAPHRQIARPPPMTRIGDPGFCSSPSFSQTGACSHRNAMGDADSDGEALPKTPPRNSDDALERFAWWLSPPSSFAPFGS